LYVEDNITNRLLLILISTFINVSPLIQSGVEASANETVVLAGSQVILTANPEGGFLTINGLHQLILGSPQAFETTANCKSNHHLFGSNKPRRMYCL
jgi:hypothetical protein